MIEQHLPSRFAQHKFITLIVGTVLLSLVLVSIALWVYASSGTELLDLSRPGYQEVSKSLADQDNKGDGFPATGVLNSDALKSLQGMYDASSKRVMSGDPFSGDPLSPDTLGLGNAPDIVAPQTTE